MTSVMNVSSIIVLYLLSVYNPDTYKRDSESFPIYMCDGICSVSDINDSWEKQRKS